MGMLALSFSAMFVRWANAPGPVTPFHRLFFSIFILLLQPMVTALPTVPLLNEIPNIWRGIGGAIALLRIYVINQDHHQRDTI